MDKHSKTRAAAIALVIAGAVGLATPSYAGVKIYLEQEKPGIRTFWTQYGMSGKWLLKCVEQTSGKGAGTKWCALQASSGTIYPRSGIQKPHSLSPQIEIWNDPGRPAEVIIKSSRSQGGGAPYIVEVDKKIFEGTAKGGNRVFLGMEAKRIVDEMARAEHFSRSFADRRGREYSGSFDLGGFSEALRFSYKFVEFDSE